MRIAVLGTGHVGRTLSARLDGLGHEVVMGTRGVEETMSRDDGLAEWLRKHPETKLDSLAMAALDAEVIINATNGAGSMPALEAVGEEQLAGKVLIDVSNPLDVSAGMPPTLFAVNDDSLGEQIQRRFPGSRVVKTLNTVTAELMVHPDRLAAGNHTVFVSGNDSEAKAVVENLLRAFGWVDIIDLGDITSARGPEMYLALWLRLWGSIGTADFNVAVVR